MLLFYLSLIDAPEEKRLFERIYTEYRQKMYQYAFFLLKNESDAEDVVHNIFLSVAKYGVEKLRKAEEEGFLWNYLSAAVRNQCFALCKKHGRELSFDTEFVDRQHAAPAGEAPPQEADYRFLVETIRALPPLYADVLYYALVQEMKAPQIARLLGMEPAAVRQRIARGRKKLIEILGEDFKP